jgi:hypothetical protein
LKVDHDDHTLEVDVDFTKRNQHNRIAELNQELFDKLLRRAVVRRIESEEDAEAQFATQADQNY